MWHIISDYYARIVLSRLICNLLPCVVNGMTIHTVLHQRGILSRQDDRWKELNRLFLEYTIWQGWQSRLTDQHANTLLVSCTQ